MLIGPVLGEQQPGQRQVLVLAQVVRFVIDADRSILGPSGRRRQVPCGDLDPGPQRGDGADVGVEAAPVQRLGLVEQARRGVVVAAGGADLRHDDVPAVPVLGDGGPFTENSGRLEVCLCAREVVQLTVELGQTDVQVGRGPRVRRTARGGGLQRLLVQPAGAARPARGDPHVGEHHRAVQLVDEVARGVQTADRIGERGQCLVDVPGRPGGQAEEAAAGAAHEVVLGSGQVQGAPGVAYGAGDIAAGLGQRRTVDRDRRRRRPQILGVRPRCREVRVAGRRRPAPLRRRRAAIRPRRGHRTSAATSRTRC